jgi:2-octaprenyl-6-methoxyphenol hydroxylase
MNDHYDIAIVGAGPVGASLACCLAGSGYRVAVLEKTPANSNQSPSYDDRGLALSLASCRILMAAGVWPGLKDHSVPIRKIHVSDRGNCGIVRLDANEMGLDAMGYVVIARALGQELMNQLQSAPGVEYIDSIEVVNLIQGPDKAILELDSDGSQNTISSKLVVGADGAGSRVRNLAGLSASIKDYNQTAIVANITTSSNAEYTAYERFTPDGPLALLPLGNSRYVSVYCVDSEQFEKVKKLSDEMYIARLEDVAGKRIGSITQLGKRIAYPLRLVKTDPQYNNRVLMLGNSAHAIHPNGAQGFNLGLRDAAFLAELLIKNKKLPGFDPGEDAMLQEYLDFRRQDQDRVIGFSDGLTEIFYSHNMIKKVIRNSAMSLFNTVPVFKHKFAMMAMGLDGRQPSLVRGIGISQL